MLFVYKYAAKIPVKIMVYSFSAIVSFIFIFPSSVCYSTCCPLCVLIYEYLMCFKALCHIQLEFNKGDFANNFCRNGFTRVIGHPTRRPEEVS